MPTDHASELSRIGSTVETIRSGRQSRPGWPGVGLRGDHFELEISARGYRRPCHADQVRAARVRIPGDVRAALLARLARRRPRNASCRTIRLDDDHCIVVGVGREPRNHGAPARCGHRVPDDALDGRARGYRLVLGELRALRRAVDRRGEGRDLLGVGKGVVGRRRRGTSCERQSEQRPRAPPLLRCRRGRAGAESFARRLPSELIRPPRRSARSGLRPIRCSP